MLLAGCDKLFIEEHPYIPDAPASCPPEFASNRFFAITSVMTWPEAEEACRSLKGISMYSHLAVANGLAEAIEITAYNATHDSYVGLTNRGMPANVYHWITLEPAEPAWSGTQPDEQPRPEGNCGRTLADNTGLADGSCLEKRRAVCECDAFPAVESRR